MQDNGFIISECEDINSLLYKPIISTQRIKYTCIDASANYIVVGSSSGSLYLFTRKSCVFQQLIPLSEGPVSRVLISPDEKTVALATKRGSIGIVSIKPSIKLLSISNEHLDHTVTCLCWNNKSSELYVGDNNGKISTTVLSIFSVNGMFQAPSCVLMHLDSSVIQIDFSIRYLLVSTLTKSYICDTSQEQFKQIGNKTRDGEFGSCFLNLSSSLEGDKNGHQQLQDDTDKVSNITGGINAIMRLNDGNVDDSSIKIFCSRPGCRLWEVTPNGIVVKTHQFKKALAIPPVNVFQSTAVNKSMINNHSNDVNETDMLNFSQLMVIRKKYLLSYTKNGIFIIDPINTNVILWTDLYKNILMASIVNEKIYLMTKSKTFHCLMLSNIDYLILKLYNYKLYNDCFNLCQLYQIQLEQLIRQYKIDNNCLDNDIELNFNELESNDYSLSLKPVITALQYYLNNQTVKLQSGIVVVNPGNGYCDNSNYKFLSSSSSSPAILSSMKKDSDCIDNESESSSESDIICNIKLNKREIDKKVNDLEHFISTESRKNDLELTTLNIQTDLEPVYSLINTLKLTLINGDINEIELLINNINNILININEKYELNDDVKNILGELIKFFKLNYHHILLENINPELIINIDNNCCLINEIINAFIDINKSKYIINCDCGYQQSNERINNEPKYYQLGQILIDKLIKNNIKQFHYICNNIPYFWRHYFMVYIDYKYPLDDDNLMCLLQTKDNTILSMLLPILNSKQWTLAVDIIQKLHMNICLSCNKPLQLKNDDIIQIDWNEIAHELIKTKGPDSTLSFLSQLEKSLPHVKFKDTLYQSLIFSKLLEQSGFKLNVKFDGNKLKNEYSSICSPEVRDTLAKSLEKDVKKPVKKYLFGSGAHHWGMRFQVKPSICSYCTLSLQTPVLLGNNGISIFPCGHAYHVNCLLQKNMTKCYLHTSDQSINSTP